MLGSSFVMLVVCLQLALQNKKLKKVNSRQSKLVQVSARLYSICFVEFSHLYFFIGHQNENAAPVVAEVCVSFRFYYFSKF
jgi:hypothetical protein